MLIDVLLNAAIIEVESSYCFGDFIALLIEDLSILALLQHPFILFVRAHAWRPLRLVFHGGDVAVRCVVDRVGRTLESPVVADVGEWLRGRATDHVSGVSLFLCHWGSVALLLMGVVNRLLIFPEAARPSDCWRVHGGGVQHPEPVVTRPRFVSHSQRQLVLGEVEDSDHFVVLDCRFTPDVFVTGVEDGLAVPPVHDSVVNDEPQDSEFSIISIFQKEICPYDLSHGPVPFPAVPQNPFTEVGLI